MLFLDVFFALDFFDDDFFADLRVAARFFELFAFFVAIAFFSLPRETRTAKSHPRLHRTIIGATLIATAPSSIRAGRHGATRDGRPNTRPVSTSTALPSAT